MAGRAGKRIGKLTARFVKTVRTAGLYPDGGNLYLKVEGGSKSWIFRWSSNGKARKHGLGSTITVTLAQAREKAAESRRMVGEHIDPREAHRAAAVAAAKTRTFDDAAKEYIEAHEAGWKGDKYAVQWRSSLKRYASPHFGKWPVSAIDVGLVMKALQPLWTRKTATASQLRARIEAILAWSTVRGFRSAQIPNPAAWKNNLSKLLAAPGKVHKTAHHPALPHTQLPGFMSDLRRRHGTVPRALEFLVLTAARSAEALGARWDEIDLAAKLWTVPAERMKGRRVHRVPLSARSIAIIEGMQAVGRSEFVFPGKRRGKGLGHTTLQGMLRRMDRDGITPHGFRSCFRDWVAEETNFQRETAEAALAHIVGDATEQAYLRGDALAKRRALMEAWAGYCDSRISTGKVIALR
jgi:integrase